MLRLLVDKRFFQTLEEGSTKRQILTNAVPREIHSLGPHLEKLKFPYLLPQNLCTVDFKLKYTIWADLQAKGSQNNVIWSLTCVRGRERGSFIPLPWQEWSVHELRPSSSAPPSSYTTNIHSFLAYLGYSSNKELSKQYCPNPCCLCGLFWKLFVTKLTTNFFLPITMWNKFWVLLGMNIALSFGLMELFISRL